MFWINSFQVWTTTQSSNPLSTNWEKHPELFSGFSAFWPFLYIVGCGSFINIIGWTHWNKRSSKKLELTQWYQWRHSNDDKWRRLQPKQTYSLTSKESIAVDHAHYQLIHSLIWHLKQALPIAKYRIFHTSHTY